MHYEKIKKYVRDEQFLPGAWRMYFSSNNLNINFGVDWDYIRWGSDADISQDLYLVFDRENLPMKGVY
jgi:hypothetical protein